MTTLTDYKFVQRILRCVTKTEVYLVGGAVRDHILGRKVKDIDLVVYGLEQEKLLQILRQFGRVDEVGVSFGIIKFKDDETGTEFDIALPRTEKKTGEGHTGFTVVADHFLPIQYDLARRDFTMNAIAMDSEGHYIDPFGGIQDIVKGVVRAVSKETFSDDPLRILRAIQFSARFGFQIEPETLDLINSNSFSLSEISGERIHTELEKLLTASQNGIDSAIAIIHNTGIWKTLFGDLSYSLEEKHHNLNYESISSIPQLLYVLLNGWMEEYTRDILIDRFKLTRQEVREIEALDILSVEIVSRYQVFCAIQKWKDVLKSEFFSGPLQDMIVEFREGVYPKSLQELDITSEELMTLGFTGKRLGNVYKLITKIIMSGGLRNTNSSIRKYVKLKFVMLTVDSI